MWNSYADGEGVMRTVWILTEEEKWRFAAHRKAIADAGIAMKDLAAACYKACRAMELFKDCIPVLKKNRNTIFQDRK